MMNEQFPRTRFNEEFPGVGRAKAQFHDSEKELLESIEHYAQFQSKDNKALLTVARFNIHESFSTLTRTTLYSPNLTNEERARIITEAYVTSDSNRVEKLREIAPLENHRKVVGDIDRLIGLFGMWVETATENEKEMDMVEGLADAFSENIRGDLMSLSADLARRSFETQ